MRLPDVQSTSTIVQTTHLDRFNNPAMNGNMNLHHHGDTYLQDGYSKCPYGTYGDNDSICLQNDFYGNDTAMELNTKITDKAINKERMIIDKQSLYVTESAHGHVNTSTYMRHDEVITIPFEHVIDVNYAKDNGISRVILDCGAQIHAFKDRNILDNIREAAITTNIIGIDGSAKASSTEIGNFIDLGEVVYSPDIRENILSFELLTRDFNITYTSTVNMFTVHTHNHRHNFKMVNGYYVLYVKRQEVTAMSAGHQHQLHHNTRNYTKHEIDRANDAYKLFAKFSYPSTQSLMLMLKNNEISNCPITTLDLTRAIDLYGTPIPSIRGKTTRQKPNKLRSDTYQLPMIRRDVQLFIDLMYINKEVIMISVSDPIDLITATNVRDRSAQELFGVILSLVAMYNSYGNDVRLIHVDNEAGIACNETQLNYLGIRLNRVAPNTHVAIVERCIRTIKERCRAIISSLPYRLPSILSPSLVKYVVQTINMIPRHNNINGESPRTQMLGRPVDYERDLALCFGTYVEVRNNIPDPSYNTMLPRTSGALSLYNSGNLSGSYVFFLLDSMKIVVRDKYVRVNLSTLAFQRIQSIGKIENYVDLNDFTLEEMSVIPEIITPLDLEPTRLQPANQIIDFDPVDDVNNNININNNINSNNDNNNNNNNNNMIVDNDDTPTPDPLAERTDKMLRELFELQHQHDSMSATPTTVDGAINLTINQSITKLGDKAKEAIINELKSCYEKNVWTPVKIRDVVYNHRSKILPSKLFVKEKLNANGELDKVKARIVACGNLQPDGEKGEYYSPTATIENIQMIIAISHKLNKKFTVLDVSNAYLNANMPDDIYMRIGKDVVNIINEIGELDHNDVEPRGSMVVKLNRALYGCKESAKLWNIHVSTILIQLGYQPNPYDKCIFVKKVDNRIDYAILYVDDIIIISEEQREHINVIDSLTQQFHKLTISCRTDDSTFEYIGMKVVLCADGHVKFDMSNYIRRLLDEYNITEKAMYPYSNNLFTIRDIDKLDNDGQSWMRSLIAKLLYVAKRNRNDILLPISFLTTRVNQYDMDDKNKLVKVMNYLNNNPMLTLNLHINLPIRLECYCDASYAPHVTGQSLTAFGMTLGRGLFACTVSKQKCIAQSIAEAELMAANRAVINLIYYQRFLSAMHLNPMRPILYQDNRAAMFLANGALPQRTKHMDVKQLFIIDLIKHKRIEEVQIPTKRMLIDHLTKPMVSPHFKDLRDESLGVLAITEWGGLL